MSGSESNICDRPKSGKRTPSASSGVPRRMFLFFSNKLGCLASLAVSVVLTLILLALFGVLG